MRHLYVGLILLFLAGCYPNSETIKISGEVRFATNGHIVFSKLNPKTIVPIDTIELINNRYFTYYAKIDTPDYYSIDFFGKQRVNLILNDQDIEIVVDGNDPIGFGRIYGSMEHDMLWELKLLRDSFNNTPKYLELKSSMRQAFIDRDSLILDSLRLEADDWVLNRNAHLRDFISEKELSLAHIEATSILNDSMSIKYKTSIAPLLLDKYPTSKQALRFYNENSN